MNFLDKDGTTKVHIPVHPWRTCVISLFHILRDLTIPYGTQFLGNRKHKMLTNMLIVKLFIFHYLKLVRTQKYYVSSPVAEVLRISYTNALLMRIPFQFNSKAFRQCQSSTGTQ